MFFGSELRRMREASGLTGKELADALGCTPQWISTMESGRKISEQSALDLDTYFTTGGHFHRLWKLAIDIELQAALPPGFPEYADHEKRARTVRAYCPLIISGLFQTERYAETVISAIDTYGTQDLIAKRMSRQALLSQEDPPRVWLTLEETALRRKVGGKEVMHEQLDALLKASEQPTVMLNIVPERVGYHAGLEGLLMILGFKDQADIAYTESSGEGMLIRDPSKVKEKLVRWDLVRGHALPIEESRAMLRSLQEDL
ncbi:helix-turn-helix domain-containing protein [Actinomadura fibrosa]|nr:helix-turn-helix transcriptional regulator [Actinomadura fibrosa]